jgi:chemotaxis protein MotA
MNLQKNGYLKTRFRRLDGVSFLIGIFGIILALSAATGTVDIRLLLDTSSLFYITIGTASVTLVQFDMRTIGSAFKDLASSLVPFRLKRLRQVSRLLDKAVEGGMKITDLKHSGGLRGDIMNDAPYFYGTGMNFDEIDEIFASSLVAEVQFRRRSVEVFYRASQLAPALGLLGTVIGLVGVLKAMGDPSQIGGAMSLALMTTAYGSALGSLVCGPAAGRIDSCAESMATVHREIIRKLHILYLRAETDLGQTRRSSAA